jgi:hypothetical protein
MYRLPWWRGSASRILRWRAPGRVSVGLILCAWATTVVLFGQDQFARDYLDGETAYQNGDWVKAEQKFQDSLKSKDAPKARGSSVRLVSQQYGYFPEYYLALIYAHLERYSEVRRYAELAKKYIKRGDPDYLTLESYESQATQALAAHQTPANRSVVPQGGQPTVASGGIGPAYALVIGIDHYDDSAFPTLKTAVSDAKAISALLHDRYGFDTRLLVDATRHDVISALDGYRRTTEETASVLVYYAGHGYYDKEADKAFWLPRDAEQGSTANWIRADDITNAIRVIPARHVIIVSDSCYSGGLTRDGSADFTPEDHDRYLQKAGQGRSRNLLSSGGNEPVADGGGGPNHSVFASALLGGLDSIERTDFTALELFKDYIAISVPGRSQQLPQYAPLQNSGHEDGDFVFHRKIAR